MSQPLTFANSNFDGEVPKSDGTVIADCRATTRRASLREHERPSRCADGSLDATSWLRGIVCRLPSRGAQRAEHPVIGRRALEPNARAV
jgi:hypothetical protein